MSEQPSRHNIFFPLTVLWGAAFVITILAAGATLISDPRAPVAIFLKEYAGIMLTVEVGGILTMALLAMAVDRRRTLQEMRERAAMAAESEMTTKGHES